MGPDYAHAEARKSPALDGKVERDSEGKEIRYPVMLTAMEKLVARKVCLAFKVNFYHHAEGEVQHQKKHFEVTLCMSLFTFFCPFISFFGQTSLGTFLCAVIHLLPT